MTFCTHCGPGKPALPGSDVCFDCYVAPHLLSPEQQLQQARDRLLFAERETNLGPALYNAARALRLAAEDRPGLEKIRLRALADSMSAELRIQNQRQA